MRAPGSANRRPQLHQGLVPVPGRSHRNQGVGQRPEASGAGSVANGNGPGQQPREHAGDIAIKHGQWPVESNGEHGARRVAAHSGKPAEGFGVARHPAAMLANDEACGGMKVASTTVVAEAGPGMENVPLGSCSQRPHRGEAAQERGVEWEGGRDLGLLEHDLRDPDAVGIASAAPRQVSPVTAVPGEQRTPPFEEHRQHGIH